MAVSIRGVGITKPLLKKNLKIGFMDRLFITVTDNKCVFDYDPMIVAIRLSRKKKTESRKQ